MRVDQICLENIESQGVARKTDVEDVSDKLESRLKMLERELNDKMDSLEQQNQNIRKSQLSMTKDNDMSPVPKLNDGITESLFEERMNDRFLGFENKIKLHSMENVEDLREELEEKI